MARKARLKEVSPRVRALPSLRISLQTSKKRLTFLSVVFFVFLWYVGWRGVDDSHVVWGATIVCKPPCCTPHATASCRATSGRCALLTFGNRVAGIDVLMARKARLKEVSPRVRAKALTSNLASDLQKRLTFLSVVFCFFCGMLGGAESMTPMSRVMQPPCASPLWLPPTRHSKLMRHPRFFALLTLLFIVHTDLHTLFGCVGWPFRSFSYLCSKRL